jgi:hypothetical protein
MHRPSKSSTMAAGAFGVWWPGRRDPTTPGEGQYAWSKCSMDGITLWGAMAGHAASSTRTEIGGGLIAGLGPTGGWHLATDSQAFQKPAARLLDQMAQGVFETPRQLARFKLSPPFTVKMLINAKFSPLFLSTSRWGPSQTEIVGGFLPGSSRRGIPKRAV